MDQNGARGEKRWEAKVGEGSSLCTLPVVTKGIITGVITGWAQLSPCPRPVLEPGRAGWDISRAVGYQSHAQLRAEHRNTFSTLQVPGSRSRIPGLARSSPRRWRQIPASLPCPARSQGCCSASGEPC